MERIQIVMQICYEVDREGKRTFRNEKPLLGIQDLKEAEEEVKKWNLEELEEEKEYKGKYHLAFEYKLIEINYH